MVAGDLDVAYRGIQGTVPAKKIVSRSNYVRIIVKKNDVLTFNCVLYSPEKMSFNFLVTKKSSFLQGFFVVTVDSSFAACLWLPGRHTWPAMRASAMTAARSMETAAAWRSQVVEMEQLNHCDIDSMIW